MTQAFDNLTLSQRVYKHLREEILSDRLPPGTELSEVALSKVLEISRGPIREAMGRLAAEGLITVRPRRRAEVRSLTPQELIDAYEVREALEVLAVRLAVPRVTEADLARLGQLIDQMAEHVMANAIGDFFAVNVEFHETLCELSGNKKLQEVHHRLEGEIGRFQARTLALRGSLDGSLTEHRAILAAIRLRDVEKAAVLTAAHVTPRSGSRRRWPTPPARSPANPGPATRCLTMPCPAMPQPRWRQEARGDTRSAPGQWPDADRQLTNGLASRASAVSTPAPMRTVAPRSARDRPSAISPTTGLRPSAVGPM